MSRYRSPGTLPAIASPLTAPLSSCKVYGNNKDSLPSLTNNVVEGDMFLFPPRSPGSTPKLVIKVWETPCHTRGHIMFIVCRISDAAPDVSTSNPRSPGDDL